MKKVFVSVYEIIAGMKMAETIFNDYGAIIVSENSILDDHIIKKLQNLNITKIKIYADSDNIILSNSSEIFKERYSENVDEVKELLHDISSGKNLNAEKIETVSDSIFSRINENRDVVGCLNQVKSIDDYTYTHCVNVSMLCMLMGKWLKYDEKRLKLLIQAGLIHDIGKAKISSEILNKPCALTAEEFDEIKKHPTYGFRMIEQKPDFDKNIGLGILMHHEREDGSGYPLGLTGPNIHPFAKVIAVADIYDAMTSNRSYHEKESPFEVFNLMQNNAFGYLDSVVTNTFLTNIAAYYIGDLVMLNTGVIAEIAHINSRNISQPLLKLNDSYIDLTMQRDIKIIELI